MKFDSSRTFVSSVVCVDLVGFSKRPIAEQGAIKEAFNKLLAAEVASVPAEDRIILDTGDGAAITFLGDPDGCLRFAMRLRDRMNASAAKLGMGDTAPGLGPVRIGINMGPVKLAPDMNGQANIIGDGINVAGRITAFAKPGHIVVTRSFHEMVSRITPEYAGLFHYEGRHTDANARQHEIFALRSSADAAAQDEVEPASASIPPATPPVELPAAVAPAPRSSGALVDFLRDRRKVAATAVGLIAIIAVEAWMIDQRRVGTAAPGPGASPGAATPAAVEPPKVAGAPATVSPREDPRPPASREPPSQPAAPAPGKVANRAPEPPAPKPSPAALPRSDPAPATPLAGAPSPKTEPSKTEPSKVEPPRAQPSKPEPPKVEVSKAQPSKPEPPKVEVSKAPPSKPEPSKVEPSKAPAWKPEPPKVEPSRAPPSKLEPPKVEPPKVAATSPASKTAKPTASVPGEKGTATAIAPAPPPAPASIPAEISAPRIEPPVVAAAPVAAPSAETRIVSRAPINFPPAALRAGVESGMVKARLTINGAGAVTQVAIVSANPPRVFDREVVRSLENWKFNAGADKRTYDVELTIKRPEPE